MKISKKIGLGLSLAVIMSAIFLFTPSKIAFAASPDLNLRFGDSNGNTITGDLSGSKFIFKQDQNNSNGQITIYKISSGTAVCSGSIIEVSGNLSAAVKSGTNNASTFNNTFKYGKGCQSYSGPLSIAPYGGGTAPRILINWTGAKGVLSADGGTLAVTFSDGSKLNFIDKTPGDTPINFKPDQTSTGKIGGANVGSWCDDTVLGGNGSRGITISSYKATSASVDICYNTTTTQTYSPLPVDTSAYKVDPSATATDNSCEANYTGAAHTLNWVFCSILEGIDSMFNTMYNTISSQLNICTGKSSTTGDTCGNNLLDANVHRSWAVFRDLATALLVIVMLVMVFSQAISIGPLDAYTVRKMLPRLVAMAILIQISWPMLKFFVDISNDLGNGIQNLMLAPFGGAGKLAFDNQIGQVGVAAPGLTLTAGAVFTGAVLAFSGITIFGWLLIGLSAVASVLVGLLVLLFRQMLIILAIILAPLAFIAYILPGTQNYWKLWKDNFTKLLLMFPLIMAMIAGGKIFASVGTNTGNFLGLIVVLVGFVGPLWFLPKTFKWGGQIFSAAASGVWGATKGMRNAPGKYSLSQAKLNREQRAHDRNARLAENQSTHPRFDRLLAGGYNPVLSRRARDRRYAANRAQGRKAGEEALAESLTGGQYENLDHPYKIDTLRTVAQGGHDARTGIDGTNNPAAQRWALDELAKYGDWDIISNLRDNGGIDERTWQAFVAKNISAIHQNIPHLSPQRTDLSTQGIEEIPGYKDFEATELREQAENYEVRDGVTGARRMLTDPGERLAHRIRHVTRAQAALNDPQIRRRMTTHQISELEAISALNIDSPTAQVIEVQGSREPQIVLPTNLGTAEANESISRELAGPSGNRVASALTQRIARADPTTPRGQSDEAAFSTYLQLLESQNSPAARRIRNQLVLDLSNNLEENIHATERAAVEAGHSQADINIEVAQATRYRDEKMARLHLSMSATPATPRPSGPPTGSPFNTGLQ